MPAPSNQWIQALGIYSAALLLFSLGDTAIKAATYSFPFYEVAWFRYAVQLVLMLFVVRIWENPTSVRPKRIWLQLLRAVILMVGTVFSCIAMRYLQLAETVSISFAIPFVIAALSGPLLGEWCGPRRWAAIAVGFIGVLIVMQPGSDKMHWAMMYSVAATLCFATYFLLTRILAATDSNSSMLFVSALVGTVFLAPFAYAEWVVPTGFVEGGTLIAVGVFAMSGHYLVTEAYKRESASALAPFMYQQIIWMILLGYFVFGDVPQTHTMIGASVVIGSGIYLLLREHYLAQRASKRASTEDT
ncbi:DMT family transporter [Polycladidibacter hongkongensis]|uniref:DMT family transporter n=1 Tax=Polycladidibacter hongkongensis TaxID=1647556 RepID=UPI00083596C3|nr:DMT family transporter [Pseudovibrio hongkongensis]